MYFNVNLTRINLTLMLTSTIGYLLFFVSDYITYNGTVYALVSAPTPTRFQGHCLPPLEHVLRKRLTLGELFLF